MVATFLGDGDDGGGGDRFGIGEGVDGDEWWCCINFGVATVELKVVLVSLMMVVMALFGMYS